MSILTNRILYSASGVISDVSKDLLKYQSGIAAFGSYNAASDYIYIGSFAPFNHVYIKMQTVSVVSPNVMQVHYWNGREWQLCYRVDDDTNGLTQSGFVTFFINKDKKWVRESTNDKGESVTGLTTAPIYDLYWLRIRLTNNIPLGFSISWIGQKFSDDEDLASEFPDLVRAPMFQTFGPSKTSWEEQHVKAAEIIVSDLISGHVIDWKGQILIREEFTLASVYKVAQIIYTALGLDYTELAAQCEKEYQKRLNKSIFRIDKNSDALLSELESISRQGFLTR
ncbi:MAG: hypothetical protein QW818_02450 [Candidatus Aenigmatarchaeota archaeon]